MIFPWLQTAWMPLLAQRDRLHHALLIHGPAGIGKSDFALELARALLCEAPAADGSACGQCPSCGWIAQGNHPDLRVLSPAADERAEEAAKPAKASKDIRIDQVRALERFTGVGGHRGGRLVVIVDPADALNTAAANALLKTLEEPSARTQFVLVTHRPDALPATIRSRCRALALALPEIAQAVEWLAKQASVEPAQASAWLAAAAGAPLRAWRFADPDVAAAHRLTVESIAGLPETGIVRAADAMAGIEAAVWAGVLQQWVTDLGRVRVGAEPRFFPDRADRLHALARATSLPALDRLAAQLIELIRVVEHPLNARLLLEDALMRVCTALAPR